MRLARLSVKSLDDDIVGKPTRENAIRRYAIFVLLLCVGWPSRAQSPPPCPTPAPLVGPASCDVAGYLGIFKAGTDPVSATHFLEAKYGFVADKIFGSAILGFYASRLSAQQVAFLRCESQIAYAERDLPVCMPLVPCPPDPPASGPCPAAVFPVPLASSTSKLLLALVFGAVGLLVLRNR